MGTSAPSELPLNELWLDVGNRVGPMVLDNHSGEAEAMSSSQLVIGYFDDYIRRYVRPELDITIVLHSEPDLDAVCSAWLVKKGLFEDLQIYNNPYIQLMVDSVSENDQGAIRTDDPLSCWPIVMREIIGGRDTKKFDVKIIEEWFDLLDKSLGYLKQGKSLSEAASLLVTPKIKLKLNIERLDYIHDIDNCIVFQIMLPFQAAILTDSNGDGDYFRASDRILCDALVVINPMSSLFKEFARNDKVNSPQKKGFQLLITCFDIELSDHRRFHRYIISTDPIAGVNLRGLGERLERKEQEKEEKLGLPLLPGRERTTDGTGRFGWNVKSPWYDGRGHNFTIIDSPSINLDNGVCLSQLDLFEVLDTVWEYGDPASCIEVTKAELIYFSNNIADNVENNSSIGQNISLKSERESLVNKAIWGPEFLSLIGNSKLSSCKGGGNIQLEQFSCLPDIVIDMRKIYLINRPDTIKNIIKLLEQAIKNLNKANRPENKTSSDNFFLLDIRMKPPRGIIPKDSIAWKLILYRLLSNQETSFPQSYEYSCLDQNKFIISSEEKAQFVMGNTNCLLLSIEGSFRETDIRSQDNLIIARCIALIIAYLASVKNYLNQLLLYYFQHLKIRSLSKMSKLIIDDRNRLFWLENMILIKEISNHPFLKIIYEQLKNLFAIEDSLREAKQRLENLALAMKESRETLLSRLGFIFTTGFTPLIIALTAFTGSLLDKEYAKNSISLIPQKWLDFLTEYLNLSPNLINFIVIVFIAYVFCFGIWFLLGMTSKKPYKKRPFQ